MNKKIGAILIVAGTCIGSGMIALPLVLAKLGLIPSIMLMLFIWFIMYYTSLINLELNLQAGHGLSLGALGRYFSGRTAELIGVISLKLLCYALLAVFIYGGSSILQELLSTYGFKKYSLESIATWSALVTMGVLMLPLKLIDYINRLLFMCLIGVVIILIIGLSLVIEWSDLPLYSNKATEISVWAAIIPVVFTSFGFQVIFHTLTNYCHKNVKMLKQAFLWGSLIPAMVYILWTASVLSVVHHDNPLVYAQMAEGKVEIGELIQVLSSIAKWPAVQLLVWLISILAIITSIFGVGVGLCDTLKSMLIQKIPRSLLRSVLATILTVVPAYLVVIYVPNAFISVLGFAGMILSIIAILLPAYLFQHINKLKLYYSELKSRWLIYLSILVGMTVIVCEIYNML